MTEEAKPGDWIYFVNCSSCGKPIVHERDPSNGTKPLQFKGPGTYTTNCPACGSKNTYQGAAIQLGEVARQN